MHLCSDGIINYNISNNYNKLLSFACSMQIFVCLIGAVIYITTGQLLEYSQLINQ